MTDEQLQHLSVYTALLIENIYSRRTLKELLTILSNWMKKKPLFFGKGLN